MTARISLIKIGIHVQGDDLGKGLNIRAHRHAQHPPDYICRLVFADTFGGTSYTYSIGWLLKHVLHCTCVGS